METGESEGAAVFGVGGAGAGAGVGEQPATRRREEARANELRRIEVCFKVVIWRWSFLKWWVCREWPGFAANGGGRSTCRAGCPGGPCLRLRRCPRLRHR